MHAITRPSPCGAEDHPEVWKGYELEVPSVKVVFSKRMAFPSAVVVAWLSAMTTEMNTIR
jgi:hypothetical protein